LINGARGGTGRRNGLKIRLLREYRFDSDRAHHLRKSNELSGHVGVPREDVHGSFRVRKPARYAASPFEKIREEEGEECIASPEDEQEMAEALRHEKDTRLFLNHIADHE
jgi:hypothetical protein